MTHLPAHLIVIPASWMELFKNMEGYQEAIEDGLIGEGLPLEPLLEKAYKAYPKRTLGQFLQTPIEFP